MPQRAASTALMVAGVLLALALMLFGANLVRASERGPRWKRRLLGAGLGVLGAMGLGCKDSANGASADAPPPPPPPNGGRVTCYEAQMPPPPPLPATQAQVQQAMQRLTAQLQSLQKFAEADKLDKAVVEKVLATAEADLIVLEEDPKLKALAKDEDKAAATQTRWAARQAVDALHLRLAPPETLSGAKQWERQYATWREAGAAAAKDGNLDINDQQRLLMEVERSKADMAALRKAGLLKEPEAAFLRTGLGDLGLSLFQKSTAGKLEPTTPTLAVLCYKTFLLTTPGEVSLSHLRTRLAILKRLAVANKLPSDAVPWILEIVDADLRVLEGKGAADLKTEEDRQEARKLVTATKAYFHWIQRGEKPADLPAEEK
jgi:hypothetical protein